MTNTIPVADALASVEAFGHARRTVRTIAAENRRLRDEIIELRGTAVVQPIAA